MPLKFIYRTYYILDWDDEITKSVISINIENRLLFGQLSPETAIYSIRVQLHISRHKRDISSRYTIMRTRGKQFRTKVLSRICQFLLWKYYYQVRCCRQIDKQSEVLSFPITKGHHSSSRGFLCNLTSSVTHLTHWDLMTHTCANKLIIIGSDNGLSSGRCQIITRNNGGILSNGPIGTNFCELLIDNPTFSFTKVHLKLFSRPQCVNNVSQELPWVFCAEVIGDLSFPIVGTYHDPWNDSCHS